MRVALLLLLLVFYPYINVSAQKAKNVHGTAELILTGDMSRDKAVKQCKELAKINAIKAEFGEKVSLRSSLTDIRVNGEASSDFIEESEVITKGIWIADTKEPVVKWEMRGDDFVCIAEVWGKAQEPSVNNTSIEWGIYAGGLEEYCKTFIFKHKHITLAAMSSTSIDRNKSLSIINVKLSVLTKFTQTFCFSPTSRRMPMTKHDRLIWQKSLFCQLIRITPA